MYSHIFWITPTGESAGEEGELEEDVIDIGNNRQEVLDDDEEDEEMENVEEDDDDGPPSTPPKPTRATPKPPARQPAKKSPVPPKPATPKKLASPNARASIKGKKASGASFCQMRNPYAFMWALIPMCQTHFRCFFFCIHWYVAQCRTGAKASANASATQIQAIAAALESGSPVEVGSHYGNCVYLLVAYVDGIPVPYVGSSKNVHKRLKQHKNPLTMPKLMSKFLRNNPSYSFDDFRCYILKQHLLISEVGYWEKHFISKLSSTHPTGLNHWFAKGIPGQNKFNFYFFKKNFSLKAIRKRMHWQHYSVLMLYLMTLVCNAVKGDAMSGETGGCWHLGWCYGGWCFEGRCCENGNERVWDEWMRVASTIERDYMWERDHTVLRLRAKD